ncbi:neutral zinc metallopeptidase [Nocardioides sp. SYSU D00038]|uniref:KPN_02809 family neutral zinc metallopeptidase n=1 Tax=Nocardioides sp. SYSU D00038 TaxID=2812554 RepID=UPI0019679DA7|nr:neutral zinc metallopeptidase [Nocardioides sp. SYSU D00038]
MRFNPKARIDTGRTRDAGRGSSGGGLGRGLPIPSGIGGRGGIGSVVIILLFLVLTQCTGVGGNLLGSDDGGGSVGSDGADRYAECRSGADANESADCARKAVEVSLRSFWSATLPQQSGTDFTPTDVVTFSNGVQTRGCGSASSAVGPFYCPADRTIYLDSTFFDDVLEGQLGGQGGDFVEPYVLAHEYGHHVQNLLGTMGKVRTQQGPESDAVRLELQADCYAGMWTKGAVDSTDDSGTRIFESIDDGDISEALDAAKTVGDDRIQEASGGRVDPDGWTHGSSAQRMRWFRIGLEGGTLRDCDTFAARDLG